MNKLEKWVESDWKMQSKYFLGISGGLISNQDGASALVKDGEIIVAIEEERLVRIKHATGLLPKNAIKYCLKYARIKIQDVEAVSFAGVTYDNFKEVLKDYFEFHFGYSPKIVLLDHHLCHASSSYYLCGKKEAHILTMDYSGDRVSTMLAKGEGNKIKPLWRINKPDSLGIFYSLLTQYLGFQKDNDEYKVMGLSSYGKSPYSFDKVLQKTDKYKLDKDYLKHIETNKPAPSKQEKLFSELYSNIPFLKGKRRLSDEKITEHHFDIALSGQKALEEIVLHLLKKVGKMETLCLAGGVSLNCVLNQKIKGCGLVDNLFVPPHVSDAGLSIGGALILSVREGIEIKPFNNCYLGSEYSDKEVKKVLDLCKVKYSKPKNMKKLVAKDISKGKIVGWFQGRMEFGSRALGNRSILADPRDKDMKDKLNKLVKFREDFRPFAPSVLNEKALEYFDINNSPYMTVTTDVNEDKQKVIPAVTHIDGTSRIQTVTEEQNRKYYNLIKEFKKITGIPLVLNTSLNVRGQPIVCTPRNAVETYFSTGMDCLAIGSFYLRKLKS